MADPTERDGWAEHAAAQRRAWLALSPLQRLRWLEDAQRFAALALGAARFQDPPPDPAPSERNRRA